jgi:hypothetical protein
VAMWDEIDHRPLSSGIRELTSWVLKQTVVLMVAPYLTWLVLLSRMRPILPKVFGSLSSSSFCQCQLHTTLEHAS